MAKIDRYNGNVEAFASDSAGGERTAFGSDTTISDALDDNISVEYKRGWGIQSASSSPPMEWFNGAMFTNSQLSAYLHQAGIASWNSGQEYHGDSVCTHNGAIYMSLSNDNIGNEPAMDSSDWRQVPVIPSAGRRININGGFDVWQGGQSFSLTPSVTQIADTWFYQNSTTGLEHDIDKDNILMPGNNRFATKIEVTSAVATPGADEHNGYVHRMEGYNYSRVAGSTVSISFSVYATVTGTYCVALSNNASDRTYIAEYTVNASNTEERKTISVPMTDTTGGWDYGTDVGLRIRFTQSAGTNEKTSTVGSWVSGDFWASTNQVNNDATVGNIFAIADVQMEVGPATSFEKRDYKDELAACQRYRANISEAISEAIIGFGHTKLTATNFRAQINVPVPLRPGACTINVTPPYIDVLGDTYKISLSTIDSLVSQSNYSSCVEMTGTLNSSVLGSRQMFIMILDSWAGDVIIDNSL